jgi:HSP20 family protein
MSTLLEPFDAFAPLREAVTRVFDEGLFNPDRLVLLGRTFPVDILDRPNDYVIEASLPGVNPAHVHITTSGNTLTIRVGRTVHARSDPEGTYLKHERAERQWPAMSRTFTLPARINPDNVSASYEHGMLSVIVVKDEETKPHTIPLHVAKDKPEHK